jgi:hypothetical protein
VARVIFFLTIERSKNSGSKSDSQPVLKWDLSPERAKQPGREADKSYPSMLAEC